MSAPAIPAVVPLVIFLVTYALIATRRLRLLPIGRPAGALLGAVLMVMTGTLTPEESYRAVDHDTIVLLFGMMVLAVYVERAGLVDLVASRALAASRTGLSLLLIIGALSAGLSALLVNDTVCVFLTPVVVRVCLRARLPLAPFLLCLATSANLGSAATLVGNPQNMLIGSMSGLSFARFFALVGPAALVGVSLNLALLAFLYGRTLAAPLAADPAPPVVVDRRRSALVLVALAAVVAGYFWGLHLGYTTLAGVLLLVLADREEPREAFARVDWTLLVFFACLFIVVAGLRATGLVDDAFRALAPSLALDDASGIGAFTIAVTAGSNLVSNVPLVLLLGPSLSGLGDPTLGWALLAFVSTVAGNLTLVGSVANLIVAERAKESYALGFFEYLRFGALSCVVTLAAGVPVVWLCWRLLAAS